MSRGNDAAPSFATTRTASGDSIGCSARWKRMAGGCMRFVLMTNHEHLFLETPEPNLSAGMHLLNSSYTGYFNVRHRRAGHLFQGRFKAHLVEEEGYFTEISRYAT